MGAPRTPEETPSPNAVVVRRGEETGDPFSYVGHSTVYVGGAARTSFIPAPQPVTNPPVSG